MPGMEEQEKVWDEIKRLRESAPDAFPKAPIGPPATLPPVFVQKAAPAPDFAALDVTVALLVAAICCYKGLDHCTKGRRESRRFRPDLGSALSSGRAWSLLNGTE